MRIDNISSFAYKFVSNKSTAAKKNNDDKTFAEYMSEEREQVSKTKNRIVTINSGQLVTGDDIIASMAIHSGLTFYLQYDETSTKDNPCILAVGVDEGGTSFKKKIYLNKVDPHNATFVEITALETHLNRGKPDTRSLAYNMYDAGLNDRYNFVDDFRLYAQFLTQVRGLNYQEFNQYLADFERNYFEQFHKTA